MDVILDCYEKIAAKYPKPDPRFRIIHCQITSEDILDRFARNGVLADIQPLFIRADMEIAEELLGKERVSTSYAWKTMLDKGIHVSGSSDALWNPSTPSWLSTAPSPLRIWMDSLRAAGCRSRS